MGHIAMRNLWRQKKVGEGKVDLSKIPGESNTADLMTNILTIAEIKARLEMLMLHFRNDAHSEKMSP